MLLVVHTLAPIQNWLHGSALCGTAYMVAMCVNLMGFLCRKNGNIRKNGKFIAVNATIFQG